MDETPSEARRATLGERTESDVSNLFIGKIAEASRHPQSPVRSVPDGTNALHSFLSASRDNVVFPTTYTTRWYDPSNPPLPRDRESPEIREEHDHLVDDSFGNYSVSSDVPHRLQLWLPAAKVERVVLVTYLVAFVDDAASIRASSNQDDGRLGYIITTENALNEAHIQQIMEDSREWQNETLSSGYLENPYPFGASRAWATRKRTRAARRVLSSRPYRQGRRSPSPDSRTLLRDSGPSDMTTRTSGGTSDGKPETSIESVDDVSSSKDESGAATFLSMRRVLGENPSTGMSHDTNPTPTSLAEAIHSRSKDILESYIVGNLNHLLENELAWILPLQGDCTVGNLVSLLLEENQDGPWIFFESLDQPGSTDVLAEYHLPRCSHNGRFAKNDLSGPLSISSTIRSPSVDVFKHIESLCGLAGIVPEMHGQRAWFGSIDFFRDQDDEYTESVICYQDKENPKAPQLLLRRVVLVLENWCRAAALAQDTGLCCDRFTILSHPRPGTLSGSPMVSVKSICFKSIKDLHEYMQKLGDISRLSPDAFQEGFEACFGILQDMVADEPVPMHLSTAAYFVHLCALATQLVCVGFLSYLSSHTGPLQTFFLDTDQQKISLVGAQAFPFDERMPTLEANLVHLTCISHMLGKPVIAFWGRQLPLSSPWWAPKTRFDLNVSGEDFLDTWGPGEVYQMNDGDQEVSAIAIRGGYVVKTANSKPRWHWTLGDPDTLPEHEKFPLDRAITIGALVTWNKQCTVNLDTLECKLASALRAFGTSQPHWQKNSLEIGFEAGVEYAKLTVNSGLKNIPGVTLKSIKLQEQLRHPWRCLQESWGVQVSLCTGVAQRVRLRELVSELLPCLVPPSESQCWEELVQHNVQSIFASDADLQSWVKTLANDQQSLVLKLTRLVLEDLSKTGIETSSFGNRSLVVAWLTANGTRLCLKVPCTGESGWAQVLEDSADCATFAYVTPRCLTTDRNPCNQASCVENANRVRVLGTAISSAEVEQVMATTNWALQHGQTYYFNKFDTKLTVQANRDPVQGTTELIVTPDGFKYSAEKLWRQSTGSARRHLKRLAMKEAARRDQWIRERLQEGHLAEDVFVRVRGYDA